MQHNATSKIKSKPQHNTPDTQKTYKTKLPQNKQKSSKQHAQPNNKTTQNKTYIYIYIYIYKIQTIHMNTETPQQTKKRKKHTKH